MHAMYETIFPDFEKRARIVGIAGPKGSGKSTAAAVLRSEFGFRRQGFADQLKSMLYRIGLDHAQLFGDKKEEPSDLLCGRTPRHAMQTLGTEWGRDLIHPDLWVRATMFELHRALQAWEPSEPMLIVIDDVRFENEVKALKRAGAIFWHVRREGCHFSEHASEAGVAPERLDRILNNDGNIEGFRELVREAWRHDQENHWG